MQEDITLKIDTMITESIKALKEDYQSNEKGYLTEADCVAKLFSLLNQRMKGGNVPFLMHLEMRPYDTTSDGKIVVIGDKGEWVPQAKANDGRMIDLVLTDSDEGFWSKAFEKAESDQSCKDLKYWRILSYPVKAFRAAIEVKVRVKGNISRIYKDIDELEALTMVNPRCLPYLVVLDRRALQNHLDKIRDYANQKNVKAVLSGKQ